MITVTLEWCRPMPKEVYIKENMKGKHNGLIRSFFNRPSIEENDI